MDPTLKELLKNLNEKYIYFSEEAKKYKNIIETLEGLSITPKEQVINRKVKHSQELPLSTYNGRIKDKGRFKYLKDVCFEILQSSSIPLSTSQIAYEISKKNINFHYKALCPTIFSALSRNEVRFKRIDTPHRITQWALNQEDKE